MNTESFKKSINDKFNDLNSKIDILSLESATIDNNEQIYGYTVNQLLEKIDELKNETAYAYTAGFFDGEGYVGATEYKGFVSLRLLIVNTNLEILIKIKNLFSGYIYKNKKPKLHYKDKWTLQISDRNELKNFLEKIQPYSTIKKQQIKCALKYLELTKDSRGGKGPNISLKEQKIRLLILDRLKEMKHAELSDDELKIFAEEIENMNKDKYQHTMEDF